MQTYFPKINSADINQQQYGTVLDREYAELPHIVISCGNWPTPFNKCIQAKHDQNWKEAEDWNYGSVS